MALYGRIYHMDDPLSVENRVRTLMKIYADEIAGSEMCLVNPKMLSEDIIVDGLKVKTDPRVGMNSFWFCRDEDE
jgi:hypothetical protein